MRTDTPLTFRSGDHSLVGTLTLPDADSPVPAALLISGSGPIDRDSNMKRAPIGVMKQMAEHLADHGIASLRYDKRGVGASDGDYHAAGLSDNVADARMALQALQERDEIDPRSVFVVGHSEGAVIATEVATEQQLAGLVLLSGSAQPGKSVLRWQAAQLEDSIPTPVKLLMKLLRQDLSETQEKQFERLEATTTDVARIKLVKTNAKWFREFLAHDPTTSLSSVAAPVLAITGSKDIQVDPRDVDRIGTLVPTAFEGHVIDGVTHLLRFDDGPASTKTYKEQMRRPVDDRVLEIVSSWIETPDRQAV